MLSATKRAIFSYSVVYDPCVGKCDFRARRGVYLKELQELLQLGDQADLKSRFDVQLFEKRAHVPLYRSFAETQPLSNVPVAMPVAK
jgi:hypothetical protein